MFKIIPVNEDEFKLETAAATFHVYIEDGGLEIHAEEGHHLKVEPGTTIAIITSL